MRFTLSQRDKKKFQQHYSSRNTIENENVVVWRWKMLFLFSLVFLISVLYFFLYSPFFKLTAIETTTTTFIPQQEINNSVYMFLNNRRFGIFSQDNYFTLDSVAMEEYLKSEFKLDNVHVLREAPNGLFIFFKEEVSVFIASLNDASNEVRMYDFSGELIQRLNKDAYNTDLPYIVVSSYSAINEKIARLVIESWRLTHTSNTAFTIKAYFEENGSLLGVTDKGFEIRFSDETDETFQIHSLQVLLETFTRGEPLPQEYIDLRFGEKVYVK